MRSKSMFTLASLVHALIGMHGAALTAADAVDILSREGLLALPSRRPPLARPARSSGHQARPRRRSNRLTVSKRTRRKHRRAA